MSKLDSGSATQQAFSVADFCKLYGIGRSMAYELLKDGQIRAVKCGRRTLIRKKDADAWLDSLPSDNENREGV